MASGLQEGPSTPQVPQMLISVHLGTSSSPILQQTCPKNDLLFLRSSLQATSKLPQQIATPVLTQAEQLPISEAPAQSTKDPRRNDKFWVEPKMQRSIES